MKTVKQVLDSLEQKVSLTDNQSVSGAKNFTQVPTCNIKATAGNHLVNLACLEEKLKTSGGVGI